jgi:hypothetical protein
MPSILDNKSHVPAAGVHRLVFPVQSASGQESSTQQRKARQCGQSGAIQSTGGADIL